MRVISGNAKGIKLNTLEGINTRPTLDRVKEALFNIIQFDIKDTNILDLFSGSGSLGIEALSRGAKQVVFCDNALNSIKILQKNIKKTKFEDRAKIINKDYIKALEELENKFDIIFLDPPYKTNYSLKALSKILELNLLTKNGTIIIETNEKEKEDEIKKILENYKEKNFKIYNTRKYGMVILIFVRKG